MNTEIYRSKAGAQLMRERYRQALAQAPVENEHLRIPTPEGETFVFAAGPATAPPLILLHGSGSNAAQWADRMPALAGHFRVYAVDIIGEPGFSAPSRPPLDSDRYAVWLDAVLDHLGIESARFMGMSLGGWMTLDYATRRPARVSRVSLICPAGVGRNKRGLLLKAMALSLFGDSGRRRSVLDVLGPAAKDLAPGFLDTVVDHVRLTARHYRYRSGDLPIFTDEALHRLTMPVQVILGEEDAMIDSAETRRRFQATVPQVVVRTLPAVGHYVPAQAELELGFLTGAR